MRGEHKFLRTYPHPSDGRRCRRCPPTGYVEAKAAGVRPGSPDGASKVWRRPCRRRGAYEGRRIPTRTLTREPGARAGARARHQREPIGAGEVWFAARGQAWAARGEGKRRGWMRVGTRSESAVRRCPLSARSGLEVAGRLFTAAPRSPAGPQHEGISADQQRGGDVKRGRRRSPARP